MPAGAPTRMPRRGLAQCALRGMVVLLLGYLGIGVMMMLCENHLVYHPVSAAQDWQTPPSPDVVDVELTCADGTPVHGWFLPCPGSVDALLYLHGNAGNLSHRGGVADRLRHALNTSVLLVDYPGYGKSSGRPSEQGCYQAADAAYDWLVNERHVTPGRITLFGVSLGGGVAVDLAARKEHRALVLVKTFTSLPDVGNHLYPWLPVRWLMRNRFDSASKIGHCHRPVFIAHGSADSFVPCVLGQRLFEAANEPKRYLEMPGADHNDPLGENFFEALRDFLQAHPAISAPANVSR